MIGQVKKPGAVPGSEFRSWRDAPTPELQHAADTHRQDVQHDLQFDHDSSLGSWLGSSLYVYYDLLCPILPPSSSGLVVGHGEVVDRVRPPPQPDLEQEFGQRVGNDVMQRPLKTLGQ